MKKFRLFQNAQILGEATLPSELPFELVDPRLAWAVLAGSSDGFVGAIATFTPTLNAIALRITSPMDGNNRLLSNVLKPTDLIKTRLYTLERVAVKPFVIACWEVSNA